VASESTERSRNLRGWFGAELRLVAMFEFAKGLLVLLLGLGLVARGLGLPVLPDRRRDQAGDADHEARQERVVPHDEAAELRRIVVGGLLRLGRSDVHA